jgi:ABC-type antimicrobial peptide transport system permease subunit/ribosomal protein L27
MIYYQIRLIFRNFRRNSSSFFINLIGLATGFACAILIFLWVSDELKIDKFHKTDNQLFQVLENQALAEGTLTQEWTPDLLARTLAAELPEVKYAVSVTPASMFGKFTVSSDDNNLIKALGQFAEPSFFKIFSYNLTQGNPEQVLAGNNTVVISRKLALLLYKSTENAIGKAFEWQIVNVKKQAVVSGIFEGTPANSTSQFDFVLSYDAWINLSEAVGRKINWGNHTPQTFLVLNEGTDVKKLNNRISGFIKTKTTGSNVSLFAVPYSRQYLHGNYTNGVQSGGRIEYVRLFSFIAIFILLIAGINFINLATAKASKRFREIGIRKVIGSGRKALIAQFTGEAIILTGLAMVLSMILVWLFIPQFNLITGKQLQLILDAKFILSIFGICLITGILTGLYPALYLSSFSPLSVLKGKPSRSSGEIWARKGLVVFQFGISVVLIASMIVVYRQVQFVQNKNLGYQKDHVVYFSKEGNVAQKPQAFIAETEKIPGVVNASDISCRLVGSPSTTYGVNWEGKDPAAKINFEVMTVDVNLIETLGIELAEGRSYSEKFGDDKSKLILNQAAIDIMGLKNPIGQTVNFWGEQKQIVGVVKNFHFQSLHEKINPLIINYNPDKTLTMMVKIKAGQEKQTIAELKNLYVRFNPGFTFEYQFLDVAYQKLYEAEERVSALSKYFAGIGILISCLGLFGLAAYSSEQRLKEIGIRRVNGAQISEMMILLNKDFAKWVALAFIIATPLAWYIMHRWLESFAYKTELSWWIFAIAGLLALVIALLTVSWQSWKAATRNPVEALRYE